jgi:hypothetical protein
MGVDSIAETETRIRRALEQALVEAFPVQQKLRDVVGMLSTLRPAFGLDSITNEWTLSLTTESRSRGGGLSTVLSSIGELRKSLPVFVVFDEFQDVATFPKLVALLRGGMQLWPADLPVFVCGSKKHLLAAMFAAHKAPFASWGRDFEIPTVESEAYRSAYREWANHRLKTNGKSIAEPEFAFLVTQCDGIPEALNIVLATLYRQKTGHQVTEAEVRAALVTVTEERRGRFEEQLLRHRGAERAVLVAIAKYGPVAMPKGKEFLKLVDDVSPTGVYSALKRLEENADIYRTEHGYVISDPLLGLYLRRYR